jgi:KEOPS complex subunit Cgi121
VKTYTLSLAYGKDQDPDKTRRLLARTNPKALVQTVSEGTAANDFFVRMIAAQTINAARAGSLLAKKAEMDLLLRLAGTTQISEAISEVGSKKGEPFLLVVAGTSQLRAAALPAGGRRLPASPLSESELRRVEQAALLSVRRG